MLIVKYNKIEDEQAETTALSNLPARVPLMVWCEHGSFFKQIANDGNFRAR